MTDWPYAVLDEDGVVVATASNSNVAVMQGQTVVHYSNLTWEQSKQYAEIVLA